MSHHLGVLERAGLIIRAKEGREVHIKVRKDKLQELAALIVDLLLI
jgi:DNA-binding transcriptional ArsR family regulator